MTATSRFKRALIIGASGQVGTQIMKVLGPDRVVASSRQAGAAGCVTLDLGSIPDHFTVLDRIGKIGVDVIYCVAGMTDVERCEDQADLAMRVNCLGPARLAAIAAELGVPFIYFSTEYVFDGNRGPYREDDAANPISAYGRSKWAGERAVISSHPNPLIVRTTVVYGVDPAGKNFLYSLRRALKEGKPFRVPADQVSTPTYNRDLAYAAVCLVDSSASGIYHATGTEAISRLQFALRAAKFMGLDERLIFGVPTSELGQRAPRPLNAGLVSEKLIGSHPQVRMRPIEEAIQEWVTEAFLHT